MNAPRNLLLALCLASACFPTVHAQGTVKIEFEEFALGVSPPFVSSPFSSSPPAVSNSSTAVSIPPFNGQFLYSSGTTLLASPPDREPIRSVTLYLFVPHTSGVDNLTFINVANERVTAFGTWQSIERTFADPVPTFEITAYGVENLPWIYAIDDVEFTTIPEPQTYLLLLGGGCAVFATRRKRNSGCQQNSKTLCSLCNSAPSASRLLAVHQPAAPYSNLDIRTEHS